MFFLLYRHADDGVFKHFPKIFDHFPKISEGHTNIAEHFPNIFEYCQRLPKTFEEEPKMFRPYTNEFKYNLRDKLDISKSPTSSLVRIWKISHSSHGCSFV